MVVQNAQKTAAGKQVSLLLKSYTISP